MFTRCMTLASVSLLLFSACDKSDGSNNAAPAAAEPPPSTGQPGTPSPKLSPSPTTPAAAAVEDELDPDAIAWSQHTMASVGVSVPTMDGVEVREDTMNGQPYIRQRKKPLAMAVWVGSGRTVKTWRARYEGRGKLATLSPPEDIKICGTTGVKQTVSVTKGRMQVGGAFAQLAPSEASVEGGSGAAPVPSPTTAKAPKARWKTTPAKTITVLGFERKGTPVFASWNVETEKRDAFRVAEDAYFAGITCVK